MNESSVEVVSTAATLSERFVLGSSHENRAQTSQVSHHLGDGGRFGYGLLIRITIFDKSRSERRLFRVFHFGFLEVRLGNV